MLMQNTLNSISYCAFLKKAFAQMEKESKKKRQAAKPRAARRRTERLDPNKPFVRLFDNGATWMAFLPSFLTREEADTMFKMAKDLPWKDERSYYGNPPARSVCWFGDWDYVYAGTTKKAQPVPEWMITLAKRVARTATEFLHKYQPGCTAVVDYRGILSNW